MEQSGTEMRAMESRYRWKLAGAILGFFAPFAYFAAIGIQRVITGRFSDFHVFYTAARAMRFHQDPYVSGHRSYIYPPLIAFLYMPLTRVSESAAALIALSANIAFVASGILIIANEILSRTQARKTALGIVVISLLSVLLIFDKVKGDLQMLQTNSLILLMLALALRYLD